MSLVLFFTGHVKDEARHREAVPPVIQKHLQGPELEAARIEWLVGRNCAIGRDRRILLFQLLRRFEDKLC